MYKIDKDFDHACHKEIQTGWLFILFDIIILVTVSIVLVLNSKSIGQIAVTVVSILISFVLLLIAYLIHYNKIKPLHHMREFIAQNPFPKEGIKLTVESINPNRITFNQLQFYEVTVLISDKTSYLYVLSLVEIKQIPLGIPLIGYVCNRYLMGVTYA